MPKRLTYPFARTLADELHAGDAVSLTGIIYTARDAAHKRMAAVVEAGQALPVDLTDQIIYYAGPAPAKPGQAVGSIGPTTAGRMDRYTPKLLDLGLWGMIGKGNRSAEVIAGIIRNKGVYFAATGGAGALLAAHVRTAVPVAYEDLGTEAIYRLEVVDFPLFVAIDCHGGNLYERNAGGKQNG